MTAYLYHYSVGFPTNLRRWDCIFLLRYGAHAERAAKDDRFGKVERLPRVLDPRHARLIEAEATADGEMLKGVYRVDYDGERDLVLVVSPDGFVRTVWTNLKSDRHTTLRRNLYAMPA